MSPELKTVIGREQARDCNIGQERAVVDEWAPRRWGEPTARTYRSPTTASAMSSTRLIPSYLLPLPFPACQPASLARPADPARRFGPCLLLVTGATAETKLYSYQSPPPWGHDDEGRNALLGHAHRVAR